MIAIKDFVWPAMENWGLIVFREDLLLFEPGVSSETNKYHIFKNIAHELAHNVRILVLPTNISCSIERAVDTIFFSHMKLLSKLFTLNLSILFSVFSGLAILFLPVGGMTCGSKRAWQHSLSTASWTFLTRNGEWYSV